jgi:leader peptidase (prepilin peptidase) / N-methyltransferase
MLNSIDNSIFGAIWGIFGLVIGSFLNVVIYRIPIMLEAQWALESSASKESITSNNDEITLSKPRSQCPNCGHRLYWYENLPVISYIYLKGKCSACGTSINLKYPAIELITSFLFIYCFHRWGPSFQLIAWSTFTAILICLAFIDWDTTILPDDLNYSLLWLGLIASTLDLTSISASQSIFGAVIGYFSLWSIYWVFKILTGKDGMGYGDFKLFAALGAWFGPDSLIHISIYASAFGIIFGILLKYKNALRENAYIPFGPFLGMGSYIFIISENQKIL